MRKAGIIIFAAGLLITMVIGIDFVTNEKSVDFGNLEFTAGKNHTFDWSPLTGVAVMIIGGVVFLIAGNER